MGRPKLHADNTSWNDKFPEEANDTFYRRIKSRKTGLISPRNKFALYVTRGHYRFMNPSRMISILEDLSFELNPEDSTICEDLILKIEADASL